MRGGSCAFALSRKRTWMRRSIRRGAISKTHACTSALKVKADAIVTRNQEDFEKSSIKVFDCTGLFAYLEEEKGLVYDFVPMEKTEP